MRTPLFSVFASVLLLVTSAGCRLEGHGDVQALKPMEQEPVTLKIMYENEERFYSKYGNLFMAKYPNVNIEVASMEAMYRSNRYSIAAMEEWIERERPDVLYMMNMEQFVQYAAEGKLYDMDMVIRQDRFDLNALAPSVVELLREKGGGSLYGLGTTYYSLAMFYNKDLFDKYGVPYPQNRMSWEKVYKLAQRFAVETGDSLPVYGLQSRNGQHPYYFVKSIGGGQLLDMIDPVNQKLTLASDAWVKIVRNAADVYKSGALYLVQDWLHNKQTFGDPRNRDPFLAGRTAMAIDDVSLLRWLKEKGAKKEVTFDWDLVTVPVDPKHADTGSDFMFTDLFAISSRSSQLRPAWEFIKYIHGEEYAKIKSRTETSLMTRVKASNEAYGRNLEAFYALKPADTLLYIGYNQIPASFPQSFNVLAASEIGAVFTGGKSPEEALGVLQTKGQELLDKAIQTQREESKK
ncbi:ABC transporter substrate-binding protein [Paenibacillus ginsengarvi]|uniref:Extracellular solute-binding protein n=1 Tax=Paenibacillus ginsengarvi TaxID=400777 RepID=A0A3B0C562_9BACL|nr:extracellular solute-binding protein [Paenibacillus ginsengarvi]RKN79244.1 extracellular solute-binding protein [Paenibacillus ginsengarvi]